MGLRGMQPLGIIGANIYMGLPCVRDFVNSFHLYNNPIIYVLLSFISTVKETELQP